MVVPAYPVSRPVARLYEGLRELRIEPTPLGVVDTLDADPRQRRVPQGLRVRRYFFQRASRELRVEIRLRPLLALERDGYADKPRLCICLFVGIAVVQGRDSSCP